MQMHHLLMLLIPAVYLVMPMLVDWWLESHAPWYQLFIGWLILVLLLLLLDRRRENDV